MSTRVSIIIPNWNGRHHLEICLASLRAQSYADHEVILVDNASSDGSVAYVKEHFPEVKGAVRLARAYTGREKIIKFEGCYHGHGDSFLIKAGSGAMTLGTPPLG